MRGCGATSSPCRPACCHWQCWPACTLRARPPTPHHPVWWTESRWSSKSGQIHDGLQVRTKSRWSPSQDKITMVFKSGQRWTSFPKSYQMYPNFQPAKYTDSLFNYKTRYLSHTKKICLWQPSLENFSSFTKLLSQITPKFHLPPSWRPTVWHWSDVQHCGDCLTNTGSVDTEQAGHRLRERPATSRPGEDTTWCPGSERGDYIQTKPLTPWLGLPANSSPRFC